MKQAPSSSKRLQRNFAISFLCIDWPFFGLFWLQSRLGTVSCPCWIACFILFIGVVFCSDEAKDGRKTIGFLTQGEHDTNKQTIMPSDNRCNATGTTIARISHQLTTVKQPPRSTNIKQQTPQPAKQQQQQQRQEQQSPSRPSLASSPSRRPDFCRVGVGRCVDHSSTCCSQYISLFVVKQVIRDFQTSLFIDHSSNARNGRSYVTIAPGSRSCCYCHGTLPSFPFGFGSTKSDASIIMFDLPHGHK